MACSVTTFTAPNNSKVAAPSAAFIEERLRNGGKGYWHANSLTAAIDHSGAGTTLVLMVEPGEGVHVRFLTAEGRDEWALVDPGVADLRSIALFPGGEEMLVPRNQLVPVPLAMQAVSRFLAVGDRPEWLTWQIPGME